MIDLFSIQNIAFTLWNYSVCYLELFAIITGVTCVYLASRQKPINFIFGFFSFAALSIVFFQLGLYFNMILQCFFMGISLYGIYTWKFPKKGQENAKKEQRIRRFSLRQRIMGAFIILGSTALLGTIAYAFQSYLPDGFPLSNSNPAILFADAFVLIGAVTAQYLLARKNIECWMIYLFTDTTAVLLISSTGAYFTALLYLLYVGLGANGLFTWLKARKTQDINPFAS